MDTAMMNLERQELYSFRDLLPSPIIARPVCFPQTLDEVDRIEQARANGVPQSLPGILRHMGSVLAFYRLTRRLREYQTKVVDTSARKLVVVPVVIC